MTIDMGHPPYYALVHLVLANQLLSLFLVMNPRPLPRLLVNLTLVYFVLRGLRTTSGNVTQDFFIGNALVGQLASSMYLLWLAGPVDSWKHERDAVPVREMGLLQRFSRISAMSNDQRGVGWDCQVAHIPPRPSPSTPRRAFVLARLRTAALHLLLLEASQTYIHLSPVFQEGLPLRSQGALMRAVNIVASVSTPYAWLIMMHALAAVVAVGSGVGESEVQDWPELFGSWADAWSVRRFWGKTWHQLLRRSISTASRSLTDVLGISRGTAASGITQLCAAFLLSGLIHAGGDYMVAPESFGSSIPFFLMQPVAIVLEDAVMTLGRRAGLRDGSMWRGFGYCWVGAWFWWTAPSFLDWMIVRGGGRCEVLPFSLLQSTARCFGIL